MFARSTWGELPPDKVGDLVVALRPSIDAIAQCAGYQGAAVLANRESGAAVVITYWESAETMQASEEVASGTRAAVTSRLPSLKITEIDRLEVVVQERSAPPQANTVVRTTDIRVPPDKLDQLVAFVRDRSLPLGRAQAGFRAGLVSINRATGRAVLATIWDSAAALEAADVVLAPVREQARAAIPGQSVNVAIYEVVLAEIKLPAAA